MSGTLSETGLEGSTTTENSPLNTSSVSSGNSDTPATQNMNLTTVAAPKLSRPLVGSDPNEAVSIMSSDLMKPMATSSPDKPSSLITSNSSEPLITIDVITSPPSNSSHMTDVDFFENTRTEIPFYDTDITSLDVSNDTTEAPIFDTDFGEKSNDTFNPFLADDYDYYYFNPDVEREPYDYTQVDQDKKREEVLALWKNVDIPPAINYADFTPRDLDPYFLVLPPVLCLAFLLLVFVPCFLLKLRDDIREISGKPRKWGSQRYRKQKNITHESFQIIDPEWQMVAGGKDITANPLGDVQYVKPPGASGGHRNTYDKPSATTIPTGHAKENPAYVEENEVSLDQQSRPDPPVDYSEEEVTCVLDKEQEESEAGRSQKDSETGPVNSPDGAETPSEDGQRTIDGNFSTAPKATYPKFTGWNKDLYSNGAGFGPPARKSNGANGKPGDDPENPTWGMY